MPLRPKKQCNAPGCRNLTHSAKCDIHTKPWSKSKDDGRKIKGRRLQRERELLFDQFPLCVECEKKGRVKEAVIRDHIIPLAEGGPDIRSNTQALCKECSDAKTREESKRGKARVGSIVNT